MSSKNKGTDQLRGYSRGGLHISFRTYRRVLQSACIHWGEEKTPASIRIGKDLSFILHREKTCIRGFRPGPATAKPVSKALKDVLNVVIARREIILFW